MLKESDSAWRPRADIFGRRMNADEFDFLLA
jgi:hypothetical protein